MEEEQNGALKFLGIVMIIFGIAYAILGTLTITGNITGIFPGHENHEIINIILSYIISILAISGGVTTFTKKYFLTKNIALSLALFGLISLIYIKVSQNIFNNFDCIAIVLGAGIYYLAVVAEKELKKIEAIKAKAKEKKKAKRKENPKTKTKKTSK